MSHVEGSHHLCHEPGPVEATSRTYLNPSLGKGSKLEAALREQGGSREVEQDSQDVTIPGCEPPRVWSRRLE